MSPPVTVSSHFQSATSVDADAFVAHVPVDVDENPDGRRHHWVSAGKRFWRAHQLMSWVGKTRHTDEYV
jgi:hypothetical protein